jgi:polyisoprenoid-binding protein YceI
MKSIYTLALATLLVAPVHAADATAPSAAAGTLVLKFDQRASTLNFTGSYDGEPIEGKFGTFSGTATLDFAKPAEVRFAVTIDVASLNTDYADRDDTLTSSEWFDTAKFPNASFSSTGACVANPSKTDASKLACPGTLTLHGVSKAEVLNVLIDPTRQTISGASLIKRRDYGIGTGEWNDMGVIGEDVSIRFALVGAK